MGVRDDQFWAAFFGIVPSQWDAPGLSVRPHVGLLGYGGLWCFRHNERTVVSAPEDRVAELEERLEGCEPDQLFDETFLADILGSDFDRLIGPVFQGSLAPVR